MLLAPAFAATDWKSLKPQGYVSDFAGVIDAQSKAEIEDYAARVEQATGAQLAFVTVPSLDGLPIEDVAIDLFKAWGVGQKKKDNGAMVLLSIADRKSRLEAGPGLGGAIPDSMAGGLLDDMAPALRQGQYGAAMISVAVFLGNAIAKDQGVQIPPPQSYRPVRHTTTDSIPWPLILFGILFILSLLRRGGGGYGGGGGGGFLTGMHWVVCWGAADGAGVMAAASEGSTVAVVAASGVLAEGVPVAVARPAVGSRWQASGLVGGRRPVDTIREANG